MKIDLNVLLNTLPYFVSAVIWLAIMQFKVGQLEKEMQIRTTKLEDTQSMLHEILNRIIKLETIIEQKLK